MSSITDEALAHHIKMQENRGQPDHIAHDLQDARRRIALAFCAAKEHTHSPDQVLTRVLDALRTEEQKRSFRGP